MAQVKQTESKAVEAIKEEVRRLLSHGRPREALEVAERGLAEHPETEEFARWVHVLTPRRPRLAGKATGRPRDREMAWLREHQHEYKGQWVALDGDELVAASPDRAELERKVKEAGRPGRVLCVPIPSAESIAWT